MAHILSSLPSKLILAGAGLSFLGYCVYFDHKRRSDPDFKKNLVKKRKEQRLEASKMDEFELPDLNDSEAVQEFFLKQLQLGETILAAGDTEAGIKHFAIAVVMCAQPSHLLSVLQQSFSPAAFTLLMETLPLVKKQIMAVAMSKVAGGSIGYKEIEEDLE